MKIGMEKCFLFLMGVLEERIQIMGGGGGNIKGEDNKRNHYSITIENTYIVSTMCRLLFTALDFH